MNKIKVFREFAFNRDIPGIRVVTHRTDPLNAAYIESIKHEYHFELHNSHLFFTDHNKMWEFAFDHKDQIRSIVFVEPNNGVFVHLVKIAQKLTTVPKSKLKDQVLLIPFMKFRSLEVETQEKMLFRHGIWYVVCINEMEMVVENLKGANFTEVPGVMRIGESYLNIPSGLDFQDVQFVFPATTWAGNKHTTKVI